MTSKRFLLINIVFFENKNQREKFKIQESFIEKFKSIVNKDLSSIEMTKLLDLKIQQFFMKDVSNANEKEMIILLIIKILK